MTWTLQKASNVGRSVTESYCKLQGLPGPPKYPTKWLLYPLMRGMRAQKKFICACVYIHYYIHTYIYIYLCKIYVCMHVCMFVYIYT